MSLSAIQPVISAGVLGGERVTAPTRTERPAFESSTRTSLSREAQLAAQLAEFSKGNPAQRAQQVQDAATRLRAEAQAAPGPRGEYLNGLASQLSDGAFTGTFQHLLLLLKQLDVDRTERHPAVAAYQRALKR